MCYIHRNRPQKHRLGDGSMTALRRVIKLGGVVHKDNIQASALDTLNGLGYVYPLGDGNYRISPTGKQIVREQDERLAVRSK